MNTNKVEPYAPQQVNPNDVAWLVSQGVDENLARYALQHENGNCYKALQYARNIQSQPTSRPPPPQPQPQQVYVVVPPDPQQQSGDIGYGDFSTALGFVCGFFFGILGLLCCIFYCGGNREHRQKQINYAWGWACGVICWVPLLCCCCCCCFAYTYKYITRY